MTTNAKATVVPAAASPIPSHVAIPDPDAAAAIGRSGPVDGSTSSGTASPAAGAVGVAVGPAAIPGAGVPVAVGVDDAVAWGLAVELALAAGRAVAFGGAGGAGGCFTVALEATLWMPWIETHRPSQAIRVRA
jgi:hypothetical protein